MGHGDANTLVHTVLKSDGVTAAAAAGKAARRRAGRHLCRTEGGTAPHPRRRDDGDREFGPFEVAPKKGYVSLRGKKQFAMIGPATKSLVEIGLNMKDVAPTARLIAVPPGGMCQYKVRVGDRKDVDKALLGWIRHAYDGLI